MLRDIGGPSRRRFGELRTASAYVAELCDAILLSSGQSNRRDALNKIESAMRVLAERVQNALDALARETP